MKNARRMKIGKRIGAAWLAMLLMLCAVTGMAAETASVPSEETALFPQCMEYTGGVISRGWTDGRTLRAATLDVAYILCSDALLKVGKETTWTIVVEGGEAPYTYEYMLCWQDFSNTTHEYSPVWEEHRTGAQMSYAPTKEGRYYIDLIVTDAKGEYLTFQSQLYQTATDADEADEDTVAGKVNAIVESVIRDGMGEYAKALALHDWLIYHADYDETYSNYTPEGVLLKGSGVCQSYALAYQLLLKKVGISCLYVTGVAGGGSHAWNLVKLGGDWYHVDCTWDDPAGGGQENHAYFALPDSLMARDHTWNADGNTHVPSCTATRYTYDMCHADVVYADVSELDALVDALPSGMRTITFYYTGTQNVWDAFCTWLSDRLDRDGFGVDVTGWEITGSDGTVVVTLERSASSVALSPRALCLEQGETAALTAAVYPQSSAVVWTSSDEEIVTVSAGGIVTAHRTGTATVSCAMYGSELRDACEIEVIEAAETTRPITFCVDAVGVLTAYQGTAKRVRVPAGVTAIGAGAFAGHTGLVGVILPESVTAIEPGAFTGCANLTAIALGAGATQIDENGIPDSVKTVYAPSGSAAYAWACANGRSAVATDGARESRYVLPVALEEIGQEAFLRCEADSVVIAGGCARIGAGAFGECAALRDVYIPVSVTEIAPDAFADSLLLTIHASEGSAAYAYALAQGFDWTAE